MAYLTQKQINEMGFKHVGENVLLSDKSSYYNCKNISIGSNVRIDDFCILSAGEGGIEVGNFVHIAVYSLLIGAGKISIKDFVSISSRGSVYSSNDDYSGEFMMNPTLPSEFTNVVSGEIFIDKHVAIGSGAVILPNVHLKVGASIGALSLIVRDCESFYTYSGVPARKMMKRKENILELEKKLIKKIKSK